MFRRIGGILAACLMAAACGTPGGLQHSDIPPLGGHLALFDQAAADPATHRLFLADEGLQAIDVFDISQPTPRYLASVKVGHKPHGLAVASGLREVFAGLDGGGIAVLSDDPSQPRSNRLLQTIPTTAKTNVDLLDYDPSQQVLWAAASDDGILFKVDARAGQVIGTLPITIGLEQPRYDPTTNVLYVNDTKQDAIYRVDPDQLTVIGKWSVGVTCEPSGMGLDSTHQVAVVGCLDTTAGYSLVWDLKRGRLVRTLPDIGDADQVIFDPGSQSFMAAGTSGGVTAIGFFGGSPVGFQQLKITHADTRAVAYDPGTQTVYAPDAKAGNEGLLSFPLPRPDSSGTPLLAPLLYLVPLLALGVAVWYYGRRRARARQLAGRPMYS